MPSHSPTLFFRGVVGKFQIKYFSELKLLANNNLCGHSTSFSANVSLHNKPIPLSISLRGEKLFSMPALCEFPSRHISCQCFPEDHLLND